MFSGTLTEEEPPVDIVEFQCNVRIPGSKKKGQDTHKNSKPCMEGKDWLKDHARCQAAVTDPDSQCSPATHHANFVFVSSKREAPLAFEVHHEGVWQFGVSATAEAGEDVALESSMTSERVRGSVDVVRNKKARSLAVLDQMTAFPAARGSKVHLEGGGRATMAVGDRILLRLMPTKVDLDVIFSARYLGKPLPGLENPLARQEMKMTATTTLDGIVLDAKTKPESIMAATPAIEITKPVKNRQKLKEGSTTEEPSKIGDKNKKKDDSMEISLEPISDLEVINKLEEDKKKKSNGLRVAKDNEVIEADEIDAYDSASGGSSSLNFKGDQDSISLESTSQDHSNEGILKL